MLSRDDAFIDAEQGQSDEDSDCNVEVENEQCTFGEDNGHTSNNVTFSPELPAYNPPGMPFYLDIGDLDKFVVTGRGSPTRIDFWSENSAGIRKHMRFSEKEQLMMAVRLWSMEQCREFQVQESRSTAWKVKCLKSDEGCKWQLRACLKATHKTWEVTKLIPDHTCTSTASTNDHRHLQSRIIARRIVHFIKENALASVKQVQTHVKKTLHYDVSYKKAWIARCKAIKMVFDDWPTSFTKLPRFMAAMVYYNPGTIVVWEHHPCSLEILKTFGYMFWAFKPAIDGFLSCRSVISVDGTFLHTPYKAKLLLAVGQDANNQIFPLAYAYVDEETNESWNWFLRLLRQHVLKERQVCLISDRHKGILNAIRLQRLWQPPYAVHRLCLRHVRSNFNTKFHNTHLKKLCWDAGSTPQKRKFTKIMAEIERIDAKAAKYLREIGKEELWTLAYDGGYRHGMLTTNISESFNNAIKGVRNLPIRAAVELVFTRIVKMFQDKKEDALHCQHPLPKRPWKIYREAEIKGRKHSAVQFL